MSLSLKYVLRIAKFQKIKQSNRWVFRANGILALKVKTMLKCEPQILHKANAKDSRVLAAPAAGHGCTNLNEQVQAAELDCGRFL